jgi:hypothetical protein
MKATIDICDSGLTSATLTNDEGEVILWEDLSRDEQLWLLDSFKTFHELFSRQFIKEEYAKDSN